MNKITLTLLVLVVLVVGYAGYTKISRDEKTTNPTHQTSQPEHNSGQMMHNTAGSVLAGSRIILDNKDSLVPGTITFSFKLFGLDGHEFTDSDLKIAHEKKMHFIFLRDDMTGYQHIHPEYIASKWTVTTDIKNAGDYNVFWMNMLIIGHIIT